MAKCEKRVKTLLLDIGSVLLTNGWDRNARREASLKFGFDHETFESRHEDLFAIYEEGKISLDFYLDKTLFYCKRRFSADEIKDFILSRSRAFPKTISLFKKIKIKYGPRMVSVNNEGLELSLHRIKKFKLDSLFDFFVSSCFVHVRKPDEEIFRLALNMSFSRPEETVFIDDRIFNVETAKGLGINAFQHEDAESTRQKLSEYGLVI